MYLATLCQTVENLFDLSFNCKEGAASFVLNQVCAAASNQ
jgi:hypothetical protein